MAPKLRWQYILLLVAFLSLSLAASPTTFCKCTCFSNSTIIPLDPPSSKKVKPAPNSSSGSSDGDAKDKQHHARTCIDCTKKFCLDYNLPICAKATEDDVFTTCFQRDSAKDEAVVFIFITATVGLLAWAGVRPWWERWRASRGYAAVPS